MPSLTHTEAVERAALLAVDGYAMDLDLTTGTQTFISSVTVRFRCRRPGAGSFVEIDPARLEVATLNGLPLDPGTLDDNRLPLPDLDAENTLVVRATMPYSNTGEGLHRFTDPVDGESYVYANSFLDHAHRVFACFDQPDLKAPVTLTVVAPPQWRVLANGAGHLQGPGRWSFETTPPLSTYLVTLVAGPLHSRHAWHDGIGFGLHCRRSLAEHLEHDAVELFTVTGQCMDRYHELFAVRYPFGKYDQVFVPELSSGAMENPACVTIRDDFVFRSAVTDTQREERAVMIAHELAHMWFGDLVTMRWWDDLWLNESFAEYLGYRVTAEATRFTGAWTSFAVDAKGWGYAADQRPSKHPVAPQHVPDAADALLNFDGISYAKGAAALRQLVVWLGDDVFFGGLRRYFATHRFGNASLADLLTALEASSGRDLAEWSRLWLRSAGVTTLRPVVEVDATGRYTAVAVAQSPVDAQRPHRLAVSAYTRTHGALVCRERLDIDVAVGVHDGHTQVPALVGAPAADLLLVNDDDLTYAKVRLLDLDLAALPALLPAIGNRLTRALLWSAAWDTTRDAEVPAQRFVELVADVLPTEPDVKIFEAALNNARDVAIPDYLPPMDRSAALGRLVAACRRTLSCAEPGGGRQLAAARGLARCAGPMEINLLRDWLTGKALPDGLVMDAELRWAVLHRLAVLGSAGGSDIESEAERDPTAQGAQHAARCRSARPDPSAKARAWRVIVDDKDSSIHLVLATAEGFWQPEQNEVTLPYVARYFAEMPQVADRRTPQAAAKLAAAAFPQYAVSESTVALADRLLSQDNLTPGLRRVVVDGADDLRRALAARAVSIRAVTRMETHPGSRLGQAVTSTKFGRR
jgi:aminopeptidase N